MSFVSRNRTVLAVSFSTRGVAFALFQGPLSPLDWGIREVRTRQKNARSLEITRGLIGHLRPEVFVLEDSVGPYSRKSHRIHRLQRLVASLAETNGIDVVRYNRQHVRECFRAVGAVTRYEIAQTIAGQIHAFEKRLPPARKIWKAEAGRMALFDAASLAMTFYCQAGPIISPQGDTAA